MFNLKYFGSQEILSPKKLSEKLGQNHSVTTIFLIWKKVTSTNVARTKVTVTVGICFRCSQEPIFVFWSKSGRVNKIWIYEILVPKKIWFQKMFDRKKFCFQKNVGSKKILGLKKNLVQKIWFHKNVRSKKFRLQKI